MRLIHPFISDPNNSELPRAFPSPFSDTPHPIAKQACTQLQQYLNRQTDWQHDFTAPDGGKMFGVLVVRDGEDRLGFLVAFSGMLGGRWQLPGFVPPLFDLAGREAFLPAGEAELAVLGKRIEALENSAKRQGQLARRDALVQQRGFEVATLKQRHKARKAARRNRRQDLSNGDVAEQAQLLAQLSFESQQDKREWREFNGQWRLRLEDAKQIVSEMDQQIANLKRTRAQLSKCLHQQVFAGYRLRNALAEQKAMADLFPDQMPPGGAGDCAAPKLIQAAYQQGLTPIALAEFWWGASPKEAVRHHGHFYPACRGKCHPILPFMLRGLAVEQWAPTSEIFADPDAPATVYEDDDLVLVNKPWGLLSVPGKEIEDSVLSRMRRRYPAATGPLLVHRLDMSTSGLILVAKNAAAHKALQKQFLHRSVEKRYVAVLSQRLAEGVEQGTVELPLRVDLEDRPRQMVCHRYGKLAKTRWQIIQRDQNSTRVYFYPVTGRTHQLRVHAAHQDGLNAAIVGDELYGQRAERLLLHAERLGFTHPRSGEWMEVEAPVPF